MASSDVLNETLQAVTGIKLSQLEKQKNAYNGAKRSLLDDADDETDSRKRVRMLVDGAEKLPAMAPLADSPSIFLSNIRRFVEQAEWDPSLSEGFLSEHEKNIRDQLDAQSSKYAFATLYGQLVTDWTSGGEAAESDFVSVGREEMLKQRATWEDYVFHAKETDVPAINAYLDDLFANSSSKSVLAAFEQLKKHMEKFQKDWDADSKHFTQSTVDGCIRSILRSDVVTDHKLSVLNDFLGNDIVQGEIADVLNMRMATRNSFEWDGVATIEQRRQLNGRYRFYPDEDLLQAIFLEYIGMKWAVELRRLLSIFFKKAVLRSPAAKLPKETLRRRKYFLGAGNATTTGLEQDLESHWESDIVMDQLPREMFETRGSYGDDKSESEPGDSRASPLAVVQDLLHRIQASLTINKRLGKDTTVIRSDFKWFGPSLPHSSIFAVLKYFGVRQEWLDFFKKVLEVPVVFKGEEGTQIRKRGTPIGTPFSTFLGEAVLFCSEFAVNQESCGRLYRLHDDLWLWGDVETCAQGWSALEEFADLFGLNFNEEKTGSCTVSGDGSMEEDGPSSLPDGDVVWGFLKLDSATGRFIINQPKVETHIKELDHQLKACKSVFDFVQAWNLYGARFFRTNCGKIAQCFGREHVNSMLETFKHIQARVFANANGGASQHLRQMIERKLGVTDIPEGFLFFPTELGGLGLQNPFVELYSMRNSVVEDPKSYVDDFLKQEEEQYRTWKELFENGQLGYQAAQGFEDLRGQPFFSFEEFTQHRELTSRPLADTFDRMLLVPAPENIKLDQDVEDLDDAWSGRELSSYEKWVIQLYGSDIRSRFGGLNIVEGGLLPIGLIKMLRQSRFKWQN